MMNETEQKVWLEIFVRNLAFPSLSDDPTATLCGAKVRADIVVDFLRGHAACWLGVATAESDWLGFARVELLGHRLMIGRYREIALFGARLGEVQELKPDGTFGECIPFGGKSVYTMRRISRDQALDMLNPQKPLYCTCGRIIRYLKRTDPEYQEPPTDAKCDHCIRREQTETAQLDPEPENIHGPTLCNGTVMHAWERTDATKRPDHDAVEQFDEWLVCKNCTAWAEISEPAGHDDDEDDCEPNGAPDDEPF